MLIMLLTLISTYMHNIIWILSVHNLFLAVNVCKYTVRYAVRLPIKQFGPLAQGASRFEKLLARGPVDLRSYWSTNSRHRQQL